MKVDKNISIFVGEKSRSRQLQEMEMEKTDGKKKTSVFGGNINEQQDSILFKKLQARQQAMKVVGDAFAGEKKIDNEVEAHRERIRELQGLSDEENDKIAELDSKTASLKEEYGVEGDSQEQKDLETLIYYRKKKGSGAPLSEDEKAEYDRIQEGGLTEYQSRCLELEESREYIEGKLDGYKAQIKGEHQFLTDTGIERLKSNPMGEAKETAEEIMKAASDEIMGLLYQEGKEHIDEEAKKREEQAEKLKEEQEEKEELIEEIREEVKEGREQEEELAEIVTDSVKSQMAATEVTAEVQKELDNILRKMSLLGEDIKGAAVDKNT